MLVVNAARKDADLADLRRVSIAAVAVEPLFERALLALQGPAAAAVPGAPCRRRRPDAVHDRGGGGDRRLAVLASPVRAIPARTGSRLSMAAAGRRRGGRGAAARAGGRADRPRRARHAAPRGRPLPLRPRYRRDARPRSKPGSPGPSPSAVALRADFPGAAIVLRQLAEGPLAASASASAPTGALRRATARRSSTRRETRSAG